MTYHPDCVMKYCVIIISTFGRRLTRGALPLMLFVFSAIFCVTVRHTQAPWLLS